MDPVSLLVVKALWYQEEIGESGTHHFQGYMELTAPRTLSSIKSLDGFETAHLEPRRGSRDQAIAYSTKADTRVCGPYLWGETDVEHTPGKRSDIDAFMEAVKDGLSQHDAFAEFPSIHARYPRFVLAVYERLRQESLPPIPPYIPRAGWQCELSIALESAPTARTITWVYDLVGNRGKSYFAGNYSPSNSYVISGGKHADIIYAYRFERHVFFDWPRDAEDRFPYSVAESFKNGYALSTKYETKRLRFAIPHVVVFANFSPDLTKLSLDRFDIKQI